MAAKKSQDFGQGIRDRAEQRAGKKVPYRGESDWVNYTLTLDESLQLKKELFTLDTFDDLCIKLTEGDYSISFSYDTYHSCYSCIFRPATADNPNAGYLLSGKGSTPMKAFKQAAFIHWKVFDCNWAEGKKYARGTPIDD